GPAGKLFHPMADTMAFALIGALLITLTLVPVLASYWFRSGVKEKEKRIFNCIRDGCAGRTREAALLRLRPIMMTALVACLGLLPAAMSTGVGSDTQKPFAIVVVAGLISHLVLGFFVNPVLYEVVARDADRLQV